MNHRPSIGVLFCGLLLSSCADLIEESSSASTTPQNLASPSSYQAPSPSDYPIAQGAGVEELVRQAIARHPSPKALREKANALDSAAKQARFLPDPSASVGGGNLAETAAGNVVATFGVQQKIPFPGKRNAQAAILSHQAEAFRAKARSEELNLAAQVRKAWWTYYQAQRNAQILTENRTLLETLKDSVVARIAVNKATQQDFLKLENETTRITQRLATTLGQKNSARSTLNSLLYRPHNSPLPNPRASSFRSFGSASILISQAFQKHPEILASQAAIDASNSQVELAALSNRPDFTAGALWSPVSADGLAPSANGEDQFMATIGVSLPIWEGKTKAKRQGAASSLAAAQANLESTRSLIQQQVSASYATFQAERNALSLFSSQLIPDAENSFELSLTSYQTGSGSFLEVIDAWRQLLSYQLQKAENRSRLGQAEADLIKSAALQ